MSMRKSTELLTILQWQHQATTKGETKKHQKRRQFLEKKSGSLVASLPTKQNCTEKSAPKMSMRKTPKTSMWKSTELLTTTTMRNQATTRRRNTKTPEKRSGSLITSLPVKQNYNEESAPKTSSGKVLNYLPHYNGDQATTRD
ncbi:24844_t:CDS:2 [Gigaspora margarita]|uniref:24844_t:CDS:1 n=1 Tax=Gigaspora margarita TaxID=4874 RepID=A0ABN7UW42_GIGMA|nr:24844_t:CDS:2 [Gigaspora margarita]